jgi:hypothetical protein
MKYPLGATAHTRFLTGILVGPGTYEYVWDVQFLIPMHIVAWAEVE